MTIAYDLSHRVDGPLEMSLGMLSIAWCAFDCLGKRLGLPKVAHLLCTRKVGDRADWCHLQAARL